jgi:hypothetical protein
MEREDVILLALETGIMISTAYGQESNKPMPVSDAATLQLFADLIEKEVTQRIMNHV